MTRKPHAAALFAKVTIRCGMLLLIASVAVAQSPDRRQLVEALFGAIEDNDTNSVRRLLEANTNLARAPYPGTYALPLHRAASLGSLAIVEILLQHGAEVNAQGDTFDTANSRLAALDAAIWYNHPAVCRRLLDAGANPDLLSMSQGGALHFAFNYSREEMADWLLERGANPFLEGGNMYRKTTPFALAITRGNGHLVPRMLADARWQQQARDYLATHGAELLLAATQRGELEAAEALFQAGVPATARTASGYSLVQAFALAGANAAKATNFTPERWSQLRALLETNGAPCDVFAATGLGDVETARRLWSANKSLADIRDQNGETPLHWAVRTDHLALTDFWLGAGTSPSATNYAGQTALHLAAAKGLTDQVARLLAAQAPLITRDTNGWTPLDAAMQARQTDTIRILLKSDPATTPPGRGVATTIHEAASSGNVVALAALANATNINSPNELGLLPLHVAALKGQLGAAALLLDKGANVNARDPEGNTLLHLILLSRTHWIAGMPSAVWVEGLKSDSRKERFVNAFLTKDEYSSAKLVSRSVAFFLACGADAGATNGAGKTLVQIAMDESMMLFEEDRAAVLKLLGTAGDNLDIRDTNGDTPLHRAARDLDGDRAAELIAAGANLNATNRLGRTPLHISVEKLGGWGAEPVQVILKAKPDVDAQDNEGLTALHVLALSDSTFRKEATQALLDAGADPNIRDRQGRTPLHLFLTGKWPWNQAGDSIALLMKAGADPTVADNRGRTPLHYIASLNPHPLFFIRGITNCFSSPKLDYNAADQAGDTPLHLAANSGSDDVARWLIQRGARLDVTNTAGQRPRLPARLGSKRTKGDPADPTP